MHTASSFIMPVKWNATYCYYVDQKLVVFSMNRVNR